MHAQSPNYAMRWAHCLLNFNKTAIKLRTEFECTLWCVWSRYTFWTRVDTKLKKHKFYQ